jgi:MFS transporter, DHA1 family, multidrug resistance protein
MSLTLERPGSWLWLLGLFTIAGFFETMFYGQIMAFTPLYLPRLGIPAQSVGEWTGWMAAIANAFGILFLPFWGALADRYSRQPIIVRSFAAHIVAIVFMLIAGNVWVFIIGRATMNLALGNTGLMMTTLSERAPAHRIGLAFSILNAASPIGAFLGPLLGGRMVDLLGFNSLLLMNGVIMVLLIAVLSFGYKDTFKGSNKGPLLGMAVEAVQVIYRSRRLRVLFPALFLLFTGWMLATTYLSIAVLELYKGSEPGTVVGLVSGAGGLMALLFSPIMGALSDRVGHWKMLFIGAAIEVVLWPLPAFTKDIVSFSIAWAILNGVLSSVFAISFAVLSSSAAPEIRGRVMSFAYLPVNMGFIVGPAVAALIVTRYGVFSIFPLSAGFTLLSIGLLAAAMRQPTEELERV